MKFYVHINPTSHAGSHVPADHTISKLKENLLQQVHGYVENKFYNRFLYFLKSVQIFISYMLE